MLLHLHADHLTSVLYGNAECHPKEGWLVEGCINSGQKYPDIVIDARSTRCPPGRCWIGDSRVGGEVR